MPGRIVLTGIKPTGTPHLGNLIGAIRPALEAAQSDKGQSLFFIADYHALTNPSLAQPIFQMTLEIAATWLAFGLNPERTLFYRQSKVPQTFELQWLLNCFTPKGYLNRAHAYKAAVDQAVAKGEDADAFVSMGLFAYPVLMAADILLFRATHVPVGQDQVQHVEMARQIAKKVNLFVGEDLLMLPHYVAKEELAVLKGTDGRKMSKSYGNVIPLFAPSETLRRLVFQIKTDSSRPEDPKDPEACGLFALYRHFSTENAQTALRQAYATGIGWKDVKETVFAALDRSLEGPREAFARWMANPRGILEVLEAGEARARVEAEKNLSLWRHKIGIDGGIEG